MEEIIGFDALYDSMMKCKKGVLWKDSTANYYLNSIRRTDILSNSLMNGTYKPRPTMRFTITSPKPRDIESIMFSDRVYQRSLNDNYIYPMMTKSFIYDNCACQKGKGTDFARNRLKTMLQRYYRKHGNSGYVAQFDIHGYYPNMSHDKVEQLFKRRLNPEMYERVIQILHHQYKGDYGYNPGSQLIQIAGISLLNNLDHYIKEQLHIKCYVRYMDDFILVHNNKEYLEECKIKIINKLAELEFEVNPKKTKIFPLKRGINFLGFTFRFTDTGKVLMLILSENVKRERLKLRRLVNKSKKGFLPKEKVDESYASWRNHASKGNTFKLLQKMDTYYKELWRF